MAATYPPPRPLLTPEPAHPGAPDRPLAFFCLRYVVGSFVGGLGSFEVQSQYSEVE